MHIYRVLKKTPVPEDPLQSLALAQGQPFPPQCPAAGKVYPSGHHQIPHHWKHLHSPRHMNYSTF